MKPWFRRQTALDAPPVAAPPVTETVVTAPRLTAADRRAERRAARAAAPRRRGFPLFSLIILAVVAFGALMLYLAAQNGSFSEGGAVVDNSLSNAVAPIKGAEDRAGSALEAAGQHLKRAAGSPGQ